MKNGRAVAGRGFCGAMSRKDDGLRASGFGALLVFLTVLCTVALPFLFSGCNSLYELQEDELIFVSNGDGTCTLADSVGFYGKDAVIPEFSTAGERVTVIGENAFYGSGITGIAIPEGVTRIDTRAFAKCRMLRAINFPASVTEVAMYALEGCTSLEEITVSDDNSVYHDYENCLIDRESKMLIAGCMSSVIPSDGSVERIGEGAFYGCVGLKKASLPEGIKEIGAWAFSGCSSLYAVNMPSSLNEVGDFAFNDCSALESIRVPEGVKVLSRGIFRNCAALSDITLCEGLVVIGESAFFGCTSIFDPVIPDSVTTISDRAFYGCSTLDKLDLSKNVTEIGECVFAFCDLLRYVWMNYYNPVYLSVDNYVVNKETQEIVFGTRYSRVIPDDGSVTSIADKAFWGCTLLSSITIPGSVTSVGDQAFANCPGLIEVNISDGVKTIGEKAFYGCETLETVNILSRLERVGANAFAECHKLKINYFGDAIPEGWDPRWNPGSAPVTLGYVPPPPEEDEAEQ
ncbi:MAG: leucine-rich repeat domain-containing protein [Clostridia bacterium]|nr:leucine-rich repeat domain-containing protein [Clostridia bacterium]